MLSAIDKRLYIIGDLIHVAAVQFDKPGVTVGFDSDAKQAEAIRMEFFGAIWSAPRLAASRSGLDLVETAASGVLFQEQSLLCTIAEPGSDSPDGRAKKPRI